MSDSRLSEPSASAVGLDSRKDVSEASQTGLPWEPAANLIHRATRILVICHVSPDGDAIGSLLGLGLALYSLGKTPVLACESPVPVKFDYLPGFELIVNSVDDFSFDLVIGLDSSDVSRLGAIYQPDRLASTPLLNVDHHVTNLFYGDVNLVDPTVASAAEMILTLLGHLGIHLNAEPDGYKETPEVDVASFNADAIQERDIATCLLTGIVTDTVGFRTANVTPRVMQAAMRLMNAGASLARVMHFAFNQRPLVELSVLRLGLDHLQVEDGLAWSEIGLDERRAVGYEEDGDVGLAGTLVRTKEISVSAVFTEKENNEVEISFRADPGFDVAQLALRLGGGGHPAASGCTLEGSLEAAKARVLPMLRDVLRQQRKAGNPKS
jgi:phosphoesterase RecJ-like protein